MAVDGFGVLFGWLSGFVNCLGGFVNRLRTALLVFGSALF